MKKEQNLDIPHYCKNCGRCKDKTPMEVYKTLKVVRNTGWTHDIYCEELKRIVYGM